MPSDVPRDLGVRLAQPAPMQTGLVVVHRVKAIVEDEEVHPRRDEVPRVVPLRPGLAADVLDPVRELHAPECHERGDAEGREIDERATRPASRTSRQRRSSRTRRCVRRCSPTSSSAHPASASRSSSASSPTSSSATSSATISRSGRSSASSADHRASASPFAFRYCARTASIASATASRTSATSVGDCGSPSVGTSARTW